MIQEVSWLTGTPPYHVLDRSWWRAIVVLLMLSGCDHTAKFLRLKSTEVRAGSTDAAPQTDVMDPGAHHEPSTPAAESAESTLAPPSLEESSSNSALQPAEPSQPAAAPPFPPSSVASDPVSFVWGIVGLRGFPYGQVMASNGNEYNQLFSLDLNFNIWLWRAKRLYGYSDSRFWGQKPAPGITNPTQGAFDFSKREFDFNLGAAWNYYGNWEFRALAYSFNNLNRGNSLSSPQGFNDGVGLENRYYLNPTYAALGTPAFDKARATFLSIGYYPSKSMVDGDGVQFTPGAFVRVYLIWEILGPKLYLFTDDTFLADRAFRPAMFTTDTGIAYRPFARIPRLEFRLGTEDTVDMLNTDIETSAYLSARYIF
jgi:hypothetical protein